LINSWLENVQLSCVLMKQVIRKLKDYRLCWQYIGNLGKTNGIVSVNAYAVVDNVPIAV